MRDKGLFFRAGTGEKLLANQVAFDLGTLRNKRGIGVFANQSRPEERQKTYSSVGNKPPFSSVCDRLSQIGLLTGFTKCLEDTTKNDTCAQPTTTATREWLASHSNRPAVGFRVDERGGILRTVTKEVDRISDLFIKTARSERDWNSGGLHRGLLHINYVGEALVKALTVPAVQALKMYAHLEKAGIPQMPESEEINSDPPFKTVTGLSDKRKMKIGTEKVSMMLTKLDMGITYLLLACAYSKRSEGRLRLLIAAGQEWGFDKETVNRKFKVQAVCTVILQVS